MKRLTTLDPEPNPRHGPLTLTEYELVELDCVASGRAVVANAVMRYPGGEAWMRQLRTLPLHVPGPVAPEPRSTPDLALPNDIGRSLLTLALTAAVVWVGVGIVTIVVSRLY